MGGKHSTRSVIITTDQVTSVPGSSITGRIYMKFEKPVKASTLWLKFKGKETLWWNPGPLSSKSKGITHLLNLKAPVMIWEDGLIPRGDYEIPYTYNLPENLANSFHLTTPNFAGDITYKLKVEIEPENKKKVTNSVVIDICNPVESKPGLATSKNVEVSHCCSTKSFRMNVQMDRATYTPLEIPTVIMEINNKNSGTNLNLIKISLQRKVFLKSNKSSSTFYWVYIST